jgi:hypothetical protein
MPIDFSNLSAEDIAAATAAIWLPGELVRRENVRRRRNDGSSKRRNGLVRRRQCGGRWRNRRKHQRRKQRQTGGIVWLERRLHGRR